MRHNLKTSLTPDGFEAHGLAHPSARAGEPLPSPVKLDIRYVGFRFGATPALHDISFPITPTA